MRGKICLQTSCPAHYTVPGGHFLQALFTALLIYATDTF